MTVTHLGTEYGGWHVDLDLIQNGSVVIDAGIGADSSFSRSLLLRKHVVVLAIDPSPAARAHFSKEPAPPGIVFLPFAVTAGGLPARMYDRPGGSDSMCQEMPGLSERSYEVPGIDLRALIATNHVSLVKLDIEGEEFAVYRGCFGVPQVAIEFHVDQMPSMRDKLDIALREFSDAGYRQLHRTSLNEITFVLE